jgi:hypothetical protein
MLIRASRADERPYFVRNALREVEAVTGDILKPAEGKDISAQALLALGVLRVAKRAPRN